MADGFKEVCVDCKFHQAVKRELVKFENGQMYYVTGVCANDRSILKKLQVAGNLTPKMNALHWKLKFEKFTECFVQK